VVVAGLARRTKSHSTRNGPALAPSRYRFDLEISITWLPARGRPRIALETRQLIREMAHANFLWGAPRIHGELLKLGITVSQATVSRYKPPSRKDRRSQAWRTFIRNHAITIVERQSFDGHNWTRDLLSQVRSRSRVFKFRLSAFVVVMITDPSWCNVWRTVHPLLVAVARPRVRSTRIATLTTKSTALACRCRPGRSFGDDRSNSKPTRTGAETSRGNARQCAQLASARLLRVQLGVIVPSPRQITVFQTEIRALHCRPETSLFILYLQSRGPIYANHVLRSHKCSGA
jgi:hypothetical protein